MRVIGYVRVSSRNKYDQAESRPAQEKALRAWARGEGHKLVAIQSDEGASGTLTSDDRPGLKAALDAIRRGEADGLVVRELDRLARDVMVQERVLAKLWAIRPDTAVWSVKSEEQANCSRTDEPDDYTRKYMRRQFGLLAEFVRDLTVARLRNGKQHKQERGGFIGGQVPYGWRSVDGNLVEDDQEQAAIRRMRELRAGGSSYRAIVDALAAAGIPTKRGETTWTPDAVRRVLTREDVTA
jgi:DNA invertase Pin-like site-specific DNA recombinase